MPSALAHRLRERIRAQGPIPFRDWMQACLYDPEGGFYRRPSHPAGTGPGADFATSPTLHPFFAQAVADELAEAWQEAGRPDAWCVAEFGAGTGDLARHALPRLRAKGVPAEWAAVDVRPGATVPGIVWSSRPPHRFDAAVANEFLDALPFDLAEWHDGAWHDLGVGLDGDRFAWRRLRRLAEGPGQEGQRRASLPAIGPWLDGLAAAEARVALVVDYGSAGPAGDVRAFRGQAHADPLDEPGTVDLTADVDFADLTTKALAAGFECGLESQEAFLLRHGILAALNEVDRSTVEGAGAYLRMRQLLLPTGLGTAFKVARLQGREASTPE